jgi:hypothetical protein
MKQDGSDPYRAPAAGPAGPPPDNRRLWARIAYRVGQVVAGLCVIAGGLLIFMAWIADDWEGMVRFGAIAMLVVVVMPVFLASAVLTSACRPRRDH